MRDFWRGKKVLLTGHTGFKGAWLTLLLHHWGAQVYGYALAAEEESLFRFLNLSHLLAGEKLADIGDRSALESFYRTSAPDITLHMAAQALVLPSYADPVETFRVNAIGTATLLDIIRSINAPQTVIVVTSDKVYENMETGHSYSESDRLGGSDPYSASKACTEIVTTSFRRSFCSDAGKNIRIKTARAGNVIGAGDWSGYRLVPDIVRALSKGETLVIRHRQSVRPWQHVLEPLSGYLLLAEKTATESVSLQEDSFNFGPSRDSCVTVGAVVGRIAELWEEKLSCQNVDQNYSAPHEATLLHLDSTRAQKALGWQPRWTIDQALSTTVKGYKALASLTPEQAQATLVSQIDAYFQKS